MTGRRLADVPHLALRLAGALRPRPPSAEEEAWAARWLSGAEHELWVAQSAVDRAHSLAVARRIVAGPAPGQAQPERWVVAAALLHDVGKAEAGLGVAGRVAATVLELLHVRRAPGRLGRYLRYTEIGGARLAAVGSDERVVAWAREHHRPPSRRSGVVPQAEAELLAAADHAA